MGLLYYFPGQPTFNAEHAAGLGLEPVFGDKSPSWAGTHCGPDGKPGVIAAFVEPDLYVRSIEWQECAGFWLGTIPGQQLGPKDFEREIVSPGYIIELADGNQWQIPIARPGCQNYGLPLVMRINSAGVRTKSGLPRYAEIERVADQAFNGLRHASGFTDEPVAVSEDFVWSGSCAALSVNYRLTQWEVSRLGLVTNTNGMAILAALCDWPAFMEVHRAAAEAKKNESPAPTPGG